MIKTSGAWKNVGRKVKLVSLINGDMFYEDLATLKRKTFIVRGGGWLQIIGRWDGINNFECYFRDGAIARRIRSKNEK